MTVFDRHPNPTQSWPAWCSGSRFGAPSPGPATRCSAALCGVLLALLTVVLCTPALADERLAPYAGSYKIDDWESLEARGMRHRFQLDPDGRLNRRGCSPRRPTRRAADQQQSDSIDPRCHLVAYS